MKFIESLRLENGELRNLHLHQRRLDLTLLAHHGDKPRIDLKRELEHRSLPAEGLFKVRVVYGTGIEEIEIDPYIRRAVQAIELVEAGALDYRYKYAERGALDSLRSAIAAGIQPILVQDGRITDALYANVCLFDGVRWLTPDRPLLEGTARAAALSSGEVVAAPVRAEDFRKGRFTQLKLINCMTYFAEAQEVPCKAAPWMA